MPYSTRAMFDIVNNVRAYPEFLPWCGDVRILNEEGDFMEASVLMKKGPLNHWFSTRNYLQEFSTINMSLIDGPFKKLNGSWQFQAFDEESCKVELKLDFEFSTGLTSRLLSPVFSQIANTMVDSFCARAHEVYK